MARAIRIIQEDELLRKVTKSCPAEFAHQGAIHPISKISCVERNYSSGQVVIDLVVHLHELRHVGLTIEVTPEDINDYGYLELQEVMVRKMSLALDKLLPPKKAWRPN